MNPTLTIVTVCRNAHDVIEKTLQSVLSQTFRHYEYWLIDGASTDGTFDVIKRYQPAFEAKGIRMQCLSEPDKGIYDAMNKGIARAQGEWINFMNAGDVFCTADVLERVFASPYSPSITVLYGSTISEYAFGQVAVQPRTPDYLLHKMAFCHQSAFIRTADMVLHPYDVSYRLAADFAYFHELYKRGGVFHYVDVPVSVFEAEAGAAHTNRLRVNREYARIKGIDQRWSWQVKFAFKALGVTLKKAFYALLPQSAVRTLRQRNYQRLQRRHAAQQATR